MKHYFSMTPGHPLCIEATTASGAGGNTVVTVRPPAGSVYVLISARAYHDDVARTCVWGIEADSSYMEIATDFSFASGAYTTLYLKTGAPVPYLLTYNAYLAWTVVAMAGSKNAYVEAYVHKLFGKQGLS